MDVGFYRACVVYMARRIYLAGIIIGMMRGVSMASVTVMPTAVSKQYYMHGLRVPYHQYNGHGRCGLDMQYYRHGQTGFYGQPYWHAYSVLFCQYYRHAQRGVYSQAF